MTLSRPQPSHSKRHCQGSASRQPRHRSGPGKGRQRQPRPRRRRSLALPGPAGPARRAHRWLQRSPTVSPCGLSFCLADTAKAAQPVPALPRHLEIPSDKAQKGNSTRTQRLSSQAPRVAAGATYLQNQPRPRAAAVQACRQGRAFPKWIGPSDTSGLPRPALPNQIINRHIFT